VRRIQKTTGQHKGMGEKFLLGPLGKKGPQERGGRGKGKKSASPKKKRGNTISGLLKNIRKSPSKRSALATLKKRFHPKRVRGTSGRKPNWGSQEKTRFESGGGRKESCK